jgi:AcrR family transcriptional regulator
VDAAAELLARRGFAGVSMAAIGAEVGIAASAIYWHFPGKQELLVEVFDQCLDRLRAEQVGAVERLGMTREALREITRLQVEFVVRQRAFARVYYQEASSLPGSDLARLRGKQRAYVETWADLLLGLRPDLGLVGAECLVHAAIGAIQSALVYSSGLAPDALAEESPVGRRCVLTGSAAWSSRSSATGRRSDARGRVAEPATRGGDGRASARRGPRAWRDDGSCPCVARAAARRARPKAAP